MDDLDKKIAEALSDQDRELMAAFEEQGLFAQLGGLFQGKLGWLSLVTLVIGTILTFAGFYAAWKFIVVEDIAAMLHWGALAWACFSAQMMIKLWSWMRMETNRTMREIKRLELQLARQQ